MPEPHLRAADSDREAVAEALGKHMAAGRLTLAEYDERLAQTYAARTYGDLEALTTDLPPLPAAAPATPAPDAAPSASARPSPMAGGPLAGLPVPPPLPAPPVAGPWGWHGVNEHSWRAWLATSVTVLVVYLAISLSTMEFHYFWPIWVIGPWGAALLAQRITGHGNSRPDDDKRQLGH